MHHASLAALGSATAWPLYAVVAHSGAFGIVLDHRDGAAIVALVQRPYEPQHRSDVRVDEIWDLDAMALPGGCYLIRTAKTHRWTRGVVVGNCLPAMKREVAKAQKREAEATALETKYRRAAGLPKEAVVMRMSPGCQRIGAMIS